MPPDLHTVRADTKDRVAFFMGKKNTAIHFLFFFSIEDFVENIGLYALRWSKLNFGCHLTFEIIF